jgi:hypothetical protein
VKGCPAGGGSIANQPRALPLISRQSPAIRETAFAALTTRR